MLFTSRTPPKKAAANPLPPKIAGLLRESWWLALAAFVGVNLIQSAFTNFCPAEIIIRRLGLSSDAGRTDQRAAHP